MALSRKCWGFVPRVAGRFRDRDPEAMFRVAFMESLRRRQLAAGFSRSVRNDAERGGFSAFKGTVVLTSAGFKILKVLFGSK